jgi:hypothetical protein
MTVYYDCPSECDGLAAWLWGGWDFVPSSRLDNWPDGKREWGVRIFGLVFSNRKKLP